MSKILLEYLVTSEVDLTAILDDLRRVCVDVTPPEGIQHWQVTFKDKCYVQVWDNKTISVTAGVYPAHAKDPTCTLTTYESKLKPSTSILQEAETLINGDRAAAYGKVSDNFANIAKGWEAIFRTTVTPEQVGLAMAWVKIARQAYKPHRDNLIDLAGYAGCIEKIGKGE